MLSTLGCLTKYCLAYGCGPWRFETWWGFWVSLAAVVPLLLALGIASRHGRWSALLVAVVAAGLALSPIPYDLLAPDWLRDTLQKL